MPLTSGLRHSLPTRLPNSTGVLRPTRSGSAVQRQHPLQGPPLAACGGSWPSPACCCGAGDGNTGDGWWPRQKRKKAESGKTEDTRTALAVRGDVDKLVKKPARRRPRGGVDGTSGLRGGGRRGGGLLGDGRHRGGLKHGGGRGGGGQHSAGGQLRRGVRRHDCKQGKARKGAEISQQTSQMNDEQRQPSTHQTARRRRRPRQPPGPPGCLSAALGQPARRQWRPRRPRRRTRGPRQARGTAS